MTTTTILGQLTHVFISLHYNRWERKLFDQKSCHSISSVGAVAYWWNHRELKNLIILHTIFELLENTVDGIKLINKFKYWPGGKDKADSPLNMLGDTISVILGWFVAYIINNIVY